MTVQASVRSLSALLLVSVSLLGTFTLQATSATRASVPKPSPHRAGAGKRVLDSERDRIFHEWLAGHKGILFKVIHAMRSSMPTGRISFRKSSFKSGARWMRSAANHWNG